MGLFSNYFWQEMHGACSQTARTTGEFGLRERLATASDDMSMQGRNRHSNWQYAQLIGNRQSNWQILIAEGAGLALLLAGHGSAAVQTRQGVQAKSPLPLAVCLALGSPAWLTGCFSLKILALFHYKSRSSESAQLRFLPLLPLLCFFFISSII